MYDIAQRYYPGIQNVLADLESVEAARKLMNIRQDAEVRVAAMIDNAKQEKEADDLLKGQNEANKKMLLLKNVVSNITALYDEYKISEIETAFNYVIKKVKDEPRTEREISRMVINRLLDQKKTKKTNKNKATMPDMNTSQMRDFIG